MRGWSISAHDGHDSQRAQELALSKCPACLRLVRRCRDPIEEQIGNDFMSGFVGMIRLGQEGMHIVTSGNALPKRCVRVDER